MKKYVSPLLKDEKLMKIDVMAASADSTQNDELLNENPVDFGNLNVRGLLSAYYE